MPPVILVLIDGLRPDAITPERCPTLDGLMRRGTWSLKARSVMPSITLPCIASVFHSVPPTRHGITTNDWHPMARPLPGLFDVAHAAGLRTAALYNWEPLRDLGRPGSLDLSLFIHNETTPEGDDVIAEEAARLILRERPELAFVYLGTVDSAGHGYGWMSDAYLHQVGRVDGALGGLLDQLPPEYAVVVLADHGGHDRAHGTDSPEDMTVPWIAAGPGIGEGVTLGGADPVTVLDTAPTVAALLGVSAPPEWEGRAVL